MKLSRGVWTLSGVWWLIVLSGSLVADDSLQKAAQDTFNALPKVDAAATGQPLVTLGQKLYWDERLSANGKVACASCHAAEDFGSDSRVKSLDARGKLTSRHSQTVFNALLQSSLRWVGDRKSGADQAEGSLKGSMGWDQPENVVAVIKGLGYEPEFRASFPGEESPVSTRNFGKAVEAYEQTLVTRSRFDEFLEGSTTALSRQEREGLKIFLEVGCADCHEGMLLGGNRIEKFGVVSDYWEATNSRPIDEGLFKVTGDKADLHRFRVAMLRNIAKTAPYFHDGSVATLPEAIRVMGQVQLGVDLSEADVDRLEKFLKTLTGEVPDNYSNPHQR